MEFVEPSAGVFVEDGKFGVAGALAAGAVQVRHTERRANDGAVGVTVANNLHKPTVVGGEHVLRKATNGHRPPFAELRV